MEATLETRMRDTELMNGGQQIKIDRNEGDIDKLWMAIKEIRKDIKRSSRCNTI